MMTANDNTSPQEIAERLIALRAYYLAEAGRFKAKGDRDNASWCQGRASGLNEAIVTLGGEGVNLSLVGEAV